MNAARSPRTTTARSSHRSHEVSVEKSAFVTSTGSSSATSRTACPWRAAQITTQEHATLCRARTGASTARVEEDRADREHERAHQAPAERGGDVEVVLTLELLALGERDEMGLLFVRYARAGSSRWMPFWSSAVMAASSWASRRAELALAELGPVRHGRHERAVEERSLAVHAVWNLEDDSTVAKTFVSCVVTSFSRSGRGTPRPSAASPRRAAGGAPRRRAPWRPGQRRS